MWRTLRSNGLKKYSNISVKINFCTDNLALEWLSKTFLEQILRSNPMTSLPEFLGVEVFYATFDIYKKERVPWCPPIQSSLLNVQLEGVLWGEFQTGFSICVPERKRGNHILETMKCYNVIPETGMGIVS